MGNVQAKGARFQGRFRDATDRQHARSFATEEAAWAWVTAGEEEVNQGRFYDERQGRITLGQYYQQWRHSRNDRGLAVQASLDAAFDHHILPALGTTQLRNLFPTQVGVWVASEDMRALEPGTVRNIVRVFYNLIDYAVADRRMESALRDRIKMAVKLPKIKPGQIVALTPEEVGELTEAMPPRYRLTVTVAAQTGMRLGEVLGLTTERLDYAARQIHVARQVLYQPKRGRYLCRPKYGSTRTLPLPGALAEAIAAHLALEPARPALLPYFADTSSLRPTETEAGHFLFTTPAGLPWYPGAFAAVVAEATAQANLEDVTFHDLRHHFASLMVAHMASSGMTWPELQKAMGHANLSTTMDTYTHLLPSSKEPAQHYTIEQVYGRGRVRQRRFVDDE